MKYLRVGHLAGSLSPTPSRWIFLAIQSMPAALIGNAITRVIVTSPSKRSTLLKYEAPIAVRICIFPCLPSSPSSLDFPSVA